VQGIVRRDASLFSAAGREPVLQQVTSADLRAAISQLYDLLDQAREAQRQARELMLRAARAFPEIKLAANGAGRRADWRVPLLGLRTDAAPLQFQAQAVALLSALDQLSLQ